MIKSDLIYIEHIIESIKKIQDSTKAFTKDIFVKNPDIIDATLRRIEIIGEAVKNISIELKEKHPQIEWKKIAGIRDIIIHAYFSVDLDSVWLVIERDLPKLKKDITKILKTLKKEIK